ncbi:MAG: TIGR01621 family pseudouridine synthase [Agarilytica sp.]
MLPDRSISILLEHQDFIAFEKPEGVSFHSEDGCGGFVEVVRKQCDHKTLLPVHRLDKGTSGVLLLAKTREAAAELSKLFFTRAISKHYWALSIKKPSKKQGSVIGDLDRARNGAWKLARTRENPSETQFFSFGLGNGVRAFLVKPNTGKTHQIRVALKSIGAPILGDERYGGESADRMYLHATRLSFQYGGDSIHIDSLPARGEHFESKVFRELLLGFDYEAQQWPHSKLKA